MNTNHKCVVQAPGALGYKGKKLSRSQNISSKQLFNKLGSIEYSKGSLYQEMKILKDEINHFIGDNRRKTTKAQKLVIQLKKYQKMLTLASNLDNGEITKETLRAHKLENSTALLMKERITIFKSKLREKDDRINFIRNQDDQNAISLAQDNIRLRSKGVSKIMNNIKDLISKNNITFDGQKESSLRNMYFELNIKTQPLTHHNDNLRSYLEITKNKNLEMKIKLDD